MCTNEENTCQIPQVIEPPYQPKVKDSITSTEKSPDFLTIPDSLKPFHFKADSLGTAEGVCHDFVEEILWLESGYHDRKSNSECSTPSDLRQRREYDKQFTYYDRRLQHWYNYLDNREDLKEKIKSATGKGDCDILVNQNKEFNRVQLIKRILDYADRLSPDEIVRREEQLIPSRKLCWIENCYETLLKSEKCKSYYHGVIDMPKLTQHEQNFDQCVDLKPKAFLNSKHLEETIIEKKEKILDILSYYPDTNNLALIGEKAILHDRMGEKCKTTEETNMTNLLNKFYLEEVRPRTEDGIEWHVMDCDSFRPKERPIEYYLSINDRFSLDLHVKENRPINFCLSFETKVYEKQRKNLVFLKNCGTKTIDFDWMIDDPLKLSKFSMIFDGMKTSPAFYFDKNPFRLVAGEELRTYVIFSSKVPGIYSEQWTLRTDPDFFKCGKIVIHLFGYCRADQTEFNNLKKDLAKKSNDCMAQNLLKSCTTPISTVDPQKFPCYIQNITEIEIFHSLNPNLKCTQSYIDTFKDLFTLIKTELKKDIKCSTWNFEVETLKEYILQIDDDAKRKKFYFYLISIINEIKNQPLETKCNYEDQKIMIVRSIIMTGLETIVDKIQQISASTTPTKLKLEYDEVLITNRLKKPKKFKIPIKKKVKCDDLDTVSSTSFFVGKSEEIKEKRKIILDDAVYMQVAITLGNIIEDIVSVIEGMVNYYEI